MIGVAIVGGLEPVQAAEATWDGGGANANWNTKKNWSGSGKKDQPNATETAVFGTAFTSGTSINLNGSRSVLDLSITTSTDFSLNDNTLTLAGGGITRSAGSGVTTLNSAVTFGANGVWNIAGTLVVNGVVADGGSDFSLSKLGTGLLRLNGANTYTGGTTLAAGVVELGADNRLSDTGPVVFSGGTLKLNGFSDAVGALSLTGNTISVLDFGLDALASTVSFTGGTFAAGNVLEVQNWDGVMGALGQDTFRVNGVSVGAIFSNIRFYNDSGVAIGSGGMVYNAFGDIVPSYPGGIVPVPEPVDVALVVFGIGAVGLAVVRRLKRRGRSTGR